RPPMISWFESTRAWQLPIARTPSARELSTFERPDTRVLLKNQGEAPPHGSASTPTAFAPPFSPSMVLVRTIVPAALPVILTAATLFDDCEPQIALSCTSAPGELSSQTPHASVPLAPCARPRM